MAGVRSEGSDPIGGGKLSMRTTIGFYTQQIKKNYKMFFIYICDCLFFTNLISSIFQLFSSLNSKMTVLMWFPIPC